MSNPGQTVEVTFTAPSATGDYPFICSFPGHFATMRGTMHVVGG
jgi:azurin